MKRKIFAAAVAVILIITLGAILAACDGKEELPSDTPVSWDKYLRDATDKIAQSVVLDGGRTGVRLSSQIESEEGSFVMLFGLNCDLTSADGTGTCLVLEVRRAEDGKTSDAMFSLVSDNASTWINIAPGLALSDARLKIENLSVFDLLNVALKQGDEAMQKAFSDILYNVGMAFFDGVKVSPDQNTYSFFVDENFKESGEEYFNAVIAAFGENVGNALLAAFGIENAEELFALIPDMSGEITLSFGENGKAELSSEGLVVAENEAVLSADFEVRSELFADYEDKIPQGEDAAGYVLTKIGNSHMEGTVKMNNNGTSVMSYDYVLDSNLDLLRLALNDYDLEFLGEDNYIHLRVSHICDSSCGEYCTSKLAAARGSVFEIAFSPSDFDGSYNVYVSLALNALFSRDRAEEYASAAGASADAFFPEYTLFTYPVETFDRNSLLCRMLMSFYADNMFSTDNIEIDLSQLEGVDDPLLLLFDCMGETVVDELVFNVEENEFGRAQPHDIYSEVVYIIDKSVGDTKQYSTATWNEKYMQTIALYWNWEEFGEVTEGSLAGESFTNLYDAEGVLLHGVSDGAYIPISTEEILGMLGEYYVKAECTYYDKTTKYDFYARVLDIKGMDFNVDDVQEVTLKVEYPNPFLSAGLSLLNSDVSDCFVTEIPALIKITERTGESVQFTPKVEEGTRMPIIYGSKSSITGWYSAQSTTLPDYVYASARVEYEDGYVKEMELVGECDAIGVRDMVIFSDYYYSSACGDISVTWKFLEATYKGKYHIDPPDRIEFRTDADSIPSYNVGGTVYMSTITNHIDAVAYYDGEESLGIDLYLTAADLFINDIPLNKSSSYWKSNAITLGGYTVEFYVANTYQCNVRKFGFESEYFDITVGAYEEDTATYAFRQTSAEYPFWFTGVTYAFSGYISNATHGVGTTASRNLTVSVAKYGKGSLSPTVVDILAEDSPVGLKSFTASAHFSAGERADILTSNDFPSLIAEDIYTSFQLIFRSPGYYRVQLTLGGAGGFVENWYIAVAE